MPAALDRFFEDYARLYSDGDVKGVVSLCHCPFLAIRRGEAIHMPDRGAMWTHFAAAIDAYRRAADAQKWTPYEIDTRQLGEHSVFATVHWNALDADGHLDELPAACHPRRVAHAVVHKSFLMREAKRVPAAGGQELGGFAGRAVYTSRCGRRRG